MLDYRIMKEWSDELADHYYELQLWKPEKTKYHSCYSCYDAWKWQRQKCKYNSDHWDTIATGDLLWAKRLEKHYNVSIGDTKDK